MLRKQGCRTNAARWQHVCIARSSRRRASQPTRGSVKSEVKLVLKYTYFERKLCESMNGFFGRIGDGLRTFMVGRYGLDALSIAILIAAIAISLVSSLFGLGALSVLSFALMVYALFRCYSSNIPARSQELAWFERVTQRPKRTADLAAKRWKNRSTTCYFTCKNCKTVYSVPKGKGKIRVTCPKCHEQTIHTT